MGEGVQDQCVTKELDTLATALYVTTDDPALASRAAQVILAGKNYYGAAFEQHLAAAGITIIRPARKTGPPGPESGSCDRCARSSNRSRPNPSSGNT
jgi:hypothetical protein